jgi:hypothetical protein
VEDLSTDLRELTTRVKKKKRVKKKTKGIRDRSSPTPLFESMIQPQWDVVAKPFQNTHDHLPSVDKSLLFVVPDCKDDCPVCLLVLPDFDHCHYFACCGKVICLGCLKGVLDEQNERNKAEKNKSNKLPLCPFCRVPIETSRKERVSRLHNRVYAKQDDSNALAVLGFWYSEGKRKIVPQDIKHGIELLMRAIKLGSADACVSLGDAYNPLLVESGMYPGVERNLFQSIHYYEMAAMRGHMKSRFHLGVLNTRFFFDISITFKHFQIAACQGLDEALKAVQIGYMMGAVTKDEFEATLRANYESNKAVNSIQRKEAEEFWTRQSKQHDAVDISFTFRSKNL